MVIRFNFIDSTPTEAFYVSVALVYGAPHVWSDNEKRVIDRLVAESEHVRIRPDMIRKWINKLGVTTEGLIAAAVGLKEIQLVDNKLPETMPEWANVAEIFEEAKKTSKISARDIDGVEQLACGMSRRKFWAIMAAIFRKMEEAENISYDSTLEYDCEEDEPDLKDYKDIADDGYDELMSYMSTRYPSILARVIDEIPDGSATPRAYLDFCEEITAGMKSE